MFAGFGFFLLHVFSFWRDFFRKRIMLHREIQLGRFKLESGCVVSSHEQITCRKRFGYPSMLDTPLDRARQAASSLAMLMGMF